MSNQLITQHDTLRLFFTEDFYLVEEQSAFPIDQVVMENNTEKDPSPAKEIAPVPEKQYDTFDYLGKNQKNILILVNDAVNKVSTEKGSELLRNIVKAINLNANDFALINYAQYPEASYNQLKSFFSPNLTFCFGVSASRLRLDEQPLNEIYLFEDTRIIFCNNLEALAHDQQSKKALWANLKKLGL